MFNLEQLALLSFASLASIFFLGCSKDSSSSTSSSTTVLKCNGVQCVNAEDYCCAGRTISTCMEKSEVDQDAGLTCNKISGVSFPSGTWTNIGNADDWTTAFQDFDKNNDGVLNSTEFNNTFVNFTKYNTTTFENTDDPRKCCPGHGITNGTMIFGGDKLTYNGVEIKDDQCLDGSTISSHEPC